MLEFPANGNASQSPPAPPPVHETKPVTGPGADAFAAPLQFASDDGAEPRPYVTPAPEVPSSGAAAVDPGPRITTPEEAAAIGAMVGGFVKFGTALALQKHPEQAVVLFQLIAAPAAQLGKTVTPDQALNAYAAWVAAAATRVTLKHNWSIPYLDECVVAGAVGVAAYGIVPAKKGGVKNAKNANPPSSSSSTEPVTTAVDADAEIEDQ